MQPLLIGKWISRADILHVNLRHHLIHRWLLVQHDVQVIFQLQVHFQFQKPDAF